MPHPASRAKWAFTTRRARRADAVGLNLDVAAAQPGDLILARVERLGSHKRLQLSSGGFSDLWEGDRIVAACGDRYANDQFEGKSTISADGCDLLAGGGVIGKLETKHERMSAPTRLVPLGRLTDAGGAPLALARYARPRPALGRRPETVIGVVGSGMNAGKTTAAAALIRGLSAAGFAVAGLKATGTGAFGDLNAYEAAGASFAADFTDDGLASTYRRPPARVAAAVDALLGHAEAEGCDAAVVELADGLLQPETVALLSDEGAERRLDGVIFAAGDALSALGGLAMLERLEMRVLALTGLLTRAPLAMRETEHATGAAILGRGELADPAAATALLARARRGSMRLTAGAEVAA